MPEDVIERVVAAPAVALEKTFDTTKQIHTAMTENSPVKRAREYWKNLGPGLTTGAADDDPSGIATYSQTGAQYGFGLLWLAVFTFPFMAVVQEMCARIGMVTGRGLAANIRVYYPRWVLYLCTILLFIANTLNIGADLGAMAAATSLVIDVPPSLLLIGFAMFGLLLQIYSTYDKFAKYLKWLALILVSYIITAFFVTINWREVAYSTVVPSFTLTKESIFLICAILGTTISPYLFFWQTSQEVEEQILEGKTTIAARQEITTDKEMKEMRIDVWTGMFVSNLVMFFIIMICGATLNATGITSITTVADAATALRPLAGEQAFLLFALGAVGTGLLAIPVLAGSASYAISEAFGWKYGLYRKLKQAYSFYGVIILSTLIGLGLNFVGFDPIKALIYSAVANGLIAPLVLVLIVLMSSNERIMGGRKSHPIVTGIGWAITLLMILAGLATIGSFFI
jgi:NRAMP (natural resistance-associated macrophage protein)-like metal ion transporter